MRATLPRALLLCALFLFAISTVCSADTITLPSTNASGTILVTNTFQIVQGQTNNRQGCTIQNNGSNAMRVFFGPFAGASAGASVTLAAGQALNCKIGGNTVVRDAIAITGTSGDSFFANFQ
jgi:hypothetical protein